MHSRAFETVTRRTVEGISRRASLLALGGAALAATAAKPDVSQAKKGGQSCGKQQKKKCTNNKVDCSAAVLDYCPPASDDCRAALTLCCDECFSGAFLRCVEAAQAG